MAKNPPSEMITFEDTPITHAMMEGTPAVAPVVPAAATVQPVGPAASGIPAGPRGAARADWQKLSVNQGSERGQAYAQDLAIMTQQAVVNPPSPAAFSSIQTGPEFVIELDTNSAVPVEMSKALLRNLSPFMLQVEPPRVFGEAGFGQKPAKGQSVNTITDAAGALTGFDSAREALAQSGLANLGMKGNSGSVQEFATQNAKAGVQKTDPKQGVKLGPPAIADFYTAVDIARQLSAVLNTPPLVLLINPATLAISYTKVQQFSDRSRHGFIFHSWGEEQVKVSITAKCGAFISGGRGLHIASKRDSVAWQNLMNAFHLYKSNGYLYDTVGKSNAHHFVGALSMHYDGWVYYGHMESFNWTYEEGNQLGGIEFSMEFTASQMVDTASPSFAVVPMRSPIPSLSDPRYAGVENRSRNQPGNFSVGFTEGGDLRLTSQGREVSVEEATASMVPGSLVQTYAPGSPEPDATQAGRVHGLPEQPVGGQAFQSSGNTIMLPGSRLVAQQTPNNVEPFKGR
jgi:hypothetical protein